MPSRVGMASESPPFLVQALYQFKGSNNDELCFKKGDIITVTQVEDGGWWEGTLGEVTGWFPSNYVKEYKPQSEHLSPLKVVSDLAVQQRANRMLVLKDFIESEKTFVKELQQFVSNYMNPIEKSTILAKDEYACLMNNLDEIINFHESLHNGLEIVANKPPNEQRIGKLLLTLAPRFKKVHSSYCAGHPKAAFVLNKHKEQLQALFPADSTNFLTLTATLSKPFRRLDKYCTYMQEVERHLEESHQDRGDTQRAVAVYKEIATSCSMTRRQNEMEVEIANGGVRGWEGQDIDKLGHIIHMGSVAIAPDHKDRYFVLFPATLLMLSASHRMSAFIYEGKLPLTGITVTKLEDNENYKNAFEITGPLIERIVAVCQTKEDQHKWVELITQHCRMIGSKTSSLERKSKNIEIDPNYEGPWSISRLRPSAPSRSYFLKTDKPSVKAQHSFEEDAQILRVIESYCTSTNARYTLNSDNLERINGVQPNEEHMKSITGTVSDLQEKLLLLQSELEHLKVNVSDEKNAREQLQQMLKTCIPSSSASLAPPDLVIKE